jgi:hypothetical protein
LTNTLTQTTNTIGTYGDRLENSQAASANKPSPKAPVTTDVTVNRL